MGLAEALSKLERWQKWALGIAIALSVYAVVGFLVLPPIVRSQAEQALRESTGRDARIGEVRINPFLLAIAVRDFSLPDADGSRFVEFAELRADFETSSVFRGALTFRETRLVAPFVHVKIMPDGSFNFADLIVTEEEIAEAPEEESDPLAVLIGLAAIEQGRIVFTDLSHETVFEHEISPLDVELRNFGTRPDDQSPYSFTATTGAGETLKWEGNLTVVPLQSAGEFTLTGVRPRTGWLYVQDDVLFEVTDGHVDIRGRYEVDAREGLRGRLDGGEVLIRDFVIADRTSGETALAIPYFDVAGITIEYPEQAVHVDSVTSKSARFLLMRLADGSFRIEQLARMQTDDGTQAAVDAEPVPDGQANARWTYRVDRIELLGNRVEFVDEATTTAVAITLDPLDLRIRDLTSDPSETFQLALSLAAESGGQIEIEGPVVVEPQSVDLALTISDLDLRPFEPYWAPSLAVDLTSGRLGLAGRLEVRDEAAEAPRLRFAGDLRVDDLRTLDRMLAADLLSWSALELSGVALAVEPTSFALDRLRITRPAAHVVIAPDGTSNLATLVVEASEASTEASTEDDAAADAPTPVAAGPIPISIALVEIIDAVVDLQDRSVEPRFSTGVSALGGRIEGLSSDPDARAKVALAGRLDGATPMKIDGVLAPLSQDPYLDLRIAFENFELSSFTPYSGRFVGKTIERGKLFVDLDYVLESGTLAGENKVFLDQFTFGKDVESEEAVNLPVGLAVALLKNREGEIHIDLPVRGNVDDPEFSVGRVIGMALRNLITKVAMSPFSIIGGLAGADGDEMSSVVFAPGRAALDADQTAKIEALATALIERPGLSLEVTGEANEDLDRPALQDAALESELRLIRFRELESAWFGDAPASPEQVVLEPKERRRLLEQQYEKIASADAVPLPDEDADPDAREAEIARRLRDRIVIERVALRDLARRRADAIRDQLVTRGAIPAERIFLTDVEVPPATGQPPRASLALAAD